MKRIDFYHYSLNELRHIYITWLNSLYMWQRDNHINFTAHWKINWNKLCKYVNYLSHTGVVTFLLNLGSKLVLKANECNPQLKNVHFKILFLLKGIDLSAVEKNHRDTCRCTPSRWREHRPSILFVPYPTLYPFYKKYLLKNPHIHLQSICFS